MMQNKQDAIKLLRKWKFLYLLTFTLPILVFSLYLAYSMTFVPAPKDILLNNFGSVYTSDDLSKTTISEGQLKQLVFTTVRDSFTFNYLSLASNKTYEKYLNGEISTDLPDHRDSIRSLYSKEFYPTLLQEIISGPWMENIYSERRKVKTLVSIPPIRTGVSESWSLSQDNRLNAEYTGYFYVTTSSEFYKSYRFRVDYIILMERKPDVADVTMSDYFFLPMVKPNTNEWRVKNMEIEVGRKQ